MVSSWATLKLLGIVVGLSIDHLPPSLSLTLFDDGRFEGV